MKTLLENILAVEQEAARQIEKAETNGQRAIHALQANEQAMVDGVREQAQEKAKHMQKERIELARAEIKNLSQEYIQTLATIKETAHKNHGSALALARTLFMNSLP